MNLSSMMNSTTGVPICPAVAPKTSCFNGSTTNNMVFTYETCSKDSLAYAIHNNQIECVCINNPITDCRADLHYAACTSLFMTSSVVMATLISLGVISNLLVCVIYCRRKAIQKKVHNILLVNQAIADLVNCACYALPSTVLFFILVSSKTIHPIKIFNREYRHTLTLVCEFMGFLSAISSFLLYLVVACERCLSVSKPLWHRTRLFKRHIWMAVMVLWIISAIVSVIFVFVDDAWYVIYFRTLQVLSIIIIATITVLFCVTFYNARKIVLKEKGSNTEMSRTGRTKKELQLTKIFLLMYFLFLLTFFPLTLANPNEKNPLRRIKFLFFTLTAVINPVLTLTFRKEFKLRLN